MRNKQNTKVAQVGKGRGSENRKKIVTEKVRYSILNVTRNFEPIDKVKERFGWKAFVIRSTKARLPLSEAVGTIRHEYRIERVFNRLKNRLEIAPVFVKRNDQMIGLTHLGTKGVRVLTLLEFIGQSSLQEDASKLMRITP